MTLYFKQISVMIARLVARMEVLGSIPARPLFDIVVEFLLRKFRANFYENSHQKFKHFFRRGFGKTALKVPHNRCQ